MSPATFKPVDEQLAYLKKGAAEIIPEPELRASLEKSLKTGTPLRVYLGVDPTAPDLHLGHTVVLRKLKHFQDMGHTAVFLIGDFSAMIGDPTGVSETRPPLTREQVDANAKTYLAQVFKILDPAKTEVRYNSEWLGKLSSYDIIRLTARYSLARMLEREDFRERLSGGWKGQLFKSSEETTSGTESGKPNVKRPSSMAIHELLYPLLTALDAVELKSDVELGATEQKFNLLVHREIQREYDLPGQAILTMPILVGLDGQRKMSKSLGNYIGITEPPADMFGKIMSIPDDLMWTYYELTTDRTPQQIAALKQEVSSGTLHPMDAKMRLAEEIVSGFHGPDPSRKAAENFQRVFRDRQSPKETTEITVAWDSRAGAVWREDVLKGDIREMGQFTTLNIPEIGIEKWSKFLVLLKRVVSVAEAERLIKQNALEIDGETLADPMARINLAEKGNSLIRLGKKQFFRLIVQ
jgi:tyrosyl-tRNA synthetase